MSRRLGAAVLAAVLLVSFTPAQAAKKRAKPCAGSTGLAANKQVRVYQRGTTLVGCFKRTNRKRVLETEIDDLYSSIGETKVAGPWVMYLYLHTPECKADCPPGVTGTSRLNAVNIRTGTDRSASAQPSATVLSDTGVVVYLEPATPGPVQVKAIGSAGTTVLDTGNIPSDSLKLEGTTVKWTKDGAPQSAPLPG